MSFDTVSFISDLIKFESVSAESSRAQSVKDCAEFLRGKLQGFGFDAKVIKTKLHPIVFAKRASKVKPKVRILCYGHYDVQPVEPLDLWNTPPFEPVVKGGRLWGRGSADNKGPFTCILAGLLNFLDKHPDAPFDLALLIEGEEEISSVSMADFLKEHKEDLSSYDVIVLSDTSSPSVNQMVITTGLRGIVTFDALFKGPNTDLHSGIFGGAVYNPIQAMAEVCASLHGADGLVNIDGFYEGVMTVQNWERGQIEKNPFNDAKLKEYLGVDKLYAQRGVTPSEAVRLMPTLEFTGIGGGYQGEESKSVIPSECFVKISCRLVPNQDAARIVEIVKGAIKARCPAGVKVSFGKHCGLSNAYAVLPPHKLGLSETELKARGRKAEVLNRAFVSMEGAVKRNFGAEPLYLREGGSIPLIRMMNDLTGLDCIMLGLFTPQDNLHAPNESISIEMLDKAVACYEDFFSKISS